MAAGARPTRPRTQQEADDDLFVEADDPLAFTAHICQGILAGDVNSIRAKLRLWADIRMTRDMQLMVEKAADWQEEQARQRREERAAEKARFPAHRVQGKSAKSWED